MRLDFHGLITSDVAFWCGIFSTWRPPGNRVFKTRFINQKNFKKIWSLMYQPKYPKANFRNPRNTTIPILETQIIGTERAHLPSTRPGLARRSLGSCSLGSPLGSSLMFWVSFYKGYKSSLGDSTFMWSLCGKNATSNMIRPCKSSLWDSIYKPKSSLIDSRC